MKLLCKSLDLLRYHSERMNQAMSHINTIFSQLFHFIPRHDFEKLVNRYSGDYYTKYFTSWQHFITLLFSQIRQKDSIRDIRIDLTAHQDCWYHIGLKNIARSTLSDANNNRNYQIFEGLFYAILSRCRDIAPCHKFRFHNPLYSIDSTVIDLCLGLFDWAKFRKSKGAIKLHYLLNHRGCLPDFLVVTDGKQHDVKVAQKTDWPLLPDSIISVDKAYIDYKWLYSLNKRDIFFVTRSKKNMDYRITGQQEARHKNVHYDKTISLCGFYAQKDYPESLRLIKYYDPENKRYLTFLTNNFALSAYTIAQIYKSRWQIEIFFKWIKQNLKIKSFLGTTKNAVMSQIWTAMIYYLLLAYIKYQTKYAYSMLELTRLICSAIFMRVSLIDLLSLKHSTLYRIRDPVEQLTLF